MSDFAVVGAGHAGVESSFALAAAGYTVDLWTDEAELPYFRPRLIAVAFGQAMPDAVRIRPEAAYVKAGVKIRHEVAVSLDAVARTINGEHYAGVVLAQGARPFLPPFCGGGVSRLRTLWSMADARRILENLKVGSRLTIIGGGVLGVESALRAVMAGVRVTMIEAAPFLVNGVLGAAAGAVLRATLETKGITCSVGVCVASVDDGSVTLGDGTVIPDDMVLCSTGARPNVALGQSAGFLADCGLRTRSDLSLAPGVYAAGDLARPTSARPICAVRRAMLMGALAAENLLAETSSCLTRPWVDPVLPLFMKVEDVEFHTLGDVCSCDTEERRIDDGLDSNVWKSVLFRGGKPVGVRFVGTRAGFADWERQLM